MTEAARAAVQAMAVAGVENSTRQEGTQKNVGPKIGRPMIKQPTSDCKAEDKYNELKTPD